MASLPTLRASDADREHIASRLHHATVEGRLSAEELDERLGALYSARTYGELDPLVADLPMSRSSRGTHVAPWVCIGGALIAVLAVLGAAAVAIRGHVAAAAGGPGSIRLPPPVADGHLAFVLAASTAAGLVFLVGCVAAIWILLRSRSTSGA